MADRTRAVRVGHDQQSAGMFLVPCNWLPLTGDSLRPCPTCQIVHPVKTIHLYLEPGGTCLVSRGVYDLLVRAGMPNLSVVGDTADPPPLRLDQPRQEVDQANRKIVSWSPLITEGAN